MHRADGHRQNRPHGRVAAMLALAFAALASLTFGAAAAASVEPRSLSKTVADGSLPPAAQRLPEAPLVLPVDAACPANELGGTLDMLGGSAKDSRFLPVFGYARLVGYDTDYEIVPDIARSFEVEEGRIFTFHLRPGMKWSDGEPFTSEDFRYFWEDMAENPEIAKFGVPTELLVAGEEPQVSFPDRYTVRYAWSKPNPNFLASLAAATPFEIFRPAHYLKKYHARYQDPKNLAAMVEQAGQRNWVALHFKKDRSLRNDNPDMPTIQPWKLATRPPSQRLIFERNSVLLQGRPRGAAAALHRPGRADHRQSRADPGQDRRRRVRPAGGLPLLPELSVPEGGRGPGRLHGAALALRPRLARGALPEPQRRGSGVAQGPR